ncbi:MAG: CarD family transcriptional regulator [Candidatus Dojkabacteria bacterium]|nr:MAG: CarD family transcriptional regulator [Candidatus Dojkabacteria bacterium]
MKKAKNTEHSIDINSKVFYPSHGAGHVVRERMIEFGGEKQRYYEFEFVNSSLTISTPVQNIAMLGVRPVESVASIKKKVKPLKKTPNLKPPSQDYNDIITEIDTLLEEASIESFIKAIQYCNYVIKVREKEGRLIPVSISKSMKTAIGNIAGELAVSDGIEFEEAVLQFTKLTGVDAENL